MNNHKFIGRTKELEALNKRYDKGGYQCCVIYGRRRVGKTSLIKAFCAGKRRVFFTALESGTAENLDALSRSIAAGAGGAASGVAPYRSFQEALDALTVLAKEDRLILVFDEFPYLAQACAPFISMLQAQIDGKWKDLDIFLILSGSSMSFMEERVLGAKSPLFGRRTAQIKLEPFSFAETIEYFPHMNTEDLAVIYGVTGGVPMYLEQMDEELSLQENLSENFFSKDSLLRDEPNFLLRQELREPRIYGSVLEAIASGGTKLSEIASKTGMPSGQCVSYLKKLMELGIVSKEIPFGQKTCKKSGYVISDGMFRFWYRFVPKYAPLSDNLSPEAVIEQIFSGEIQDFTAGVFEKICTQWLWREKRLGRLPFLMLNAGRWWGPDPKTRQQEEIDIVGQGTDGDMLFCECKWRNEDCDDDVPDTLIRRGNLLKARTRHYIIFAKRGFSARCKRKAAAAGVRLVNFREMFAPAGR